MGFLAKDSLIGILFSGSRSKCLVQKIEIALKELVFGAYPQYREDRNINIMLTYILYGCYYAFYENRRYGDVAVLSSITELTGQTAAAALKLVNKYTLRDAVFISGIHAHKPWAVFFQLNAYVPYARQSGVLYRFRLRLWCS